MAEQEINHVSGRKPPRLLALQGLRALATFGIFLFHSSLLPHATFLVTFFFMLSGFVAVYSDADNTKTSSAKKYYLSLAQRFLSYYPVYFAAFIVAIPMELRESGALSAHLIFRSVTALTMTQTLFRECWNAFNGAGWYLSALLIISIIAWPLHLLCKKLRKRSIIILIAAILGLQLLLSVLSMYSSKGGSELYLYANPAYRLTEYFCGMLIARLFTLRIPGHKRCFRIAEFLIPAVIIAMYVIYHFVDADYDLIAYNLPLILLIYVFATQEGALSRLLSIKPLQSFAGISFSFYLLHEPFIRIIGWIIPPIGSYWLFSAVAVSALAFIVVLPLSVLSTLLYKKIKTQNILFRSRV